MSKSNKEKVYVVYEGRKPGIYMSWPDADVQVNGWKGNRYQGFNTYEQAWREWVAYCTDHGRDPYNYGNIPGRRFDCGSSSRDRRERSSAQVDEDTQSDTFIIHNNMQRQFQQICNLFRIPSPTYTLHQVAEINGEQHHRYYASVAAGNIGTPIVSIGQFARTEYDAQEHVAALLIKRLLAATGKQIRDLNYNVQILEEKLNKVVEANTEMQMEIAMLNDRMGRFNMK